MHEGWDRWGRELSRDCGVQTGILRAPILHDAPEVTMRAPETDRGKNGQGFPPLHPEPRYPSRRPSAGYSPSTPSRNRVASGGC